LFRGEISGSIATTLNMLKINLDLSMRVIQLHVKAGEL